MLDVATMRMSTEAEIPLVHGFLGEMKKRGFLVIPASAPDFLIGS
jgi:hypothetical protein